MTGFRLTGGVIDRARPLRFTFNGRVHEGFAGDTLASALIAGGERLVARSFKYHRPRGIFTAGSDEPNALVTLGLGAHALPNTRATVVELADGLAARSQNHLGPLGFDLLAVNDLLAPVLSAGFYYKTFMWPPPFWERLYEPLIRRAAGLGTLPAAPDPEVYDKGYLHCDVLVIGAGAAGLMAAQTAARAGARVILADEDFRPGGRLNAARREIGGVSGQAWAASAWAALADLPNVRCFARTTVFGAYDHGTFGALEQIAPAARAPDKPGQILWRIQARQSILCSGASERPLVFPGNDRPGVMLAGAAQAYVNRWAAAPGRRIAIFANNSGGAEVARTLEAAGLEVAALIDARPDAPAPAGLAARHIPGGQVAATRGRRGLTGITLGSGERIACDTLAVSGGWSPNLHLSCHTDATPVWRDGIQAFVPGGRLPQGMQVAGAANGTFGLAATLAEAHAAGARAVEAAGFTPSAGELPTADDTSVEVCAFWQVEAKGRAWVDLQNDVTAKDIALAAREGFRSVEHLKRYTTLGMATDQGRTANVTALALLAGMTGRTIPETGTTRYRPPYTPVAIGALAGRAVGPRFAPVRHTPAHHWAAANGASFVESGLWRRAEWFARAGEKGWRDSVDREVRAVREGVGICDVSTLGKIDIQGQDATRFVDFVYANGFSRLPVGKVRYGLMLRDDGMVMDDGTCARLGETRYLMTTTTANAGAVYRHLEFVRQCLKPGWDVHLVPETDGWAQFAVAGPRSRALLAKLVDAPFDISNDAFAFMACAELTLCGGTPARLFRISFSGELAYEVAVPASFGGSLAEVLMEAGAEFGVTPYGVEALDVLRLEKGHVGGGELNGQTSAETLGLGRMVSTRKDFIGRALAGKTVTDGMAGLRLMGLVPVDRGRSLTAGALIFAPGAEASYENDLGWISSTAWSPSLGHSIGLGFVRDGAARAGTQLRAVDRMRDTEVAVEVVAPTFYDPEGRRLHG